MADQKPLPPIPSLITLSLDARRHRSRLIRHFLSEIHDSEVEDRLGGWAIVLEEVLDEMGKCLSEGDWLDRFRRSHELRREDRRERQKQTASSGAEVKETVKPRTATLQGSKLEGQGTVDFPRQEELSPPLHLSTSKFKETHLLFCVAPPDSRVPLPVEDSGFGIVPANIGCAFVSGAYNTQETGFPTILYGNKELAVTPSESRVVGGTFTFRGVNTPSQHQHLFAVLQISVYVHLSLILEQHLLIDLGVPLVFPRPPLPSPSPSAPNQAYVELPRTKRKKRSSFLPSSLLSFLSKGNIHRSSTIMPILGHGGSVNLGIAAAAETGRENSSPRSSLELGIGRLRRISVKGDRRSPSRMPQQSTETSGMPFSNTLKQIQNSEGLLSTSYDVLFTSPTLLVDLAKAEAQSHPYRLRGDQKTGLTSILGWDGKENLGKGMSGTLGFLRHQGFSVLVAQHAPCEYSSSSEIPATTGSSPSLSSLQLAKPCSFTVCGRPSWRTYRYYSMTADEDLTIGEAIFDFAHAAPMSCEQLSCRYKRGQHETRLTHGGICITINVEENAVEEEMIENSRIDAWESCVVCDIKSKRKEMTNGTYLLSFGKFLELLVYSPALCIQKPVLCEHTTPPPLPWPNLPLSRFSILRHFSTKSHTVSFSCSVADDVFELRVPRLQIIRGNGSRCSQDSSGSVGFQIESVQSEEEKKTLRHEMKRWWEGVTDYLDKMELALTSEKEKLMLKALPRLPSSDDPSDDFETPKGSTLNSMEKFNPLLPLPSPPVRSSSTEDLSESYLSSLPPPPPPTPMKKSKYTTAERLISLRHTFLRTEQSLYAQLGRTPVSSLNDTRRSFIAAARGAEKRLLAWQKKYVSSGTDTKIPEKLSIEEPEWWDERSHAVPGSNCIIREDDWGSMISFTLSSSDYQRELTAMSFSRLASSAGPQPSVSEEYPSPSSQSSFFSLFATSKTSLPDPDIDDVVWSEPEPISVAISRTANPRDTSNIIKDVLRQNSRISTDGPGTGAGLSSRLTLTGQRPGGVAPPSAWAKPDVKISKDEADGKVSVTSPSAVVDVVEEVGKILEIDTGKGENRETLAMSRPASRASGSVTPLAVGSVEAQSRRGKPPSVISVASDITIGKEYRKAMKLPALPPKDELKPHEVPDTQSRVQSPPSTTSLFTSTLTGGFHNAMRFMLRDTESSRPTSPSPSSKSHHGLLSPDATGIDDRPHIKYDWTIGKRLKFSCMVYYAKQFDVLRRRCGVDDIFVKSLSRSANWTTEGGKSRSNFWKTGDGRFIIKTLVDAWNVADLQVLLELAPSYFRYVDATANKATVLAKMMGFYTVEVRNLETGAIQAKADLLVMENLFYDRKVSKAFDLKGIQGRKVKPTKKSKISENPKTLFDGDWIEGQQKTLVLVRPHSKHVLRTALRSDADFLAKSNIMDYSLLVGVDEDRKEISCGLVDTIGSYTFAKTLEYKAKQGLNSGKEATVIPPVEYQERFVSALERYFLACPDKWSKPLDESQITSDVSRLPSVL